MALQFNFPVFLHFTIRKKMWNSSSGMLQVVTSKLDSMENVEADNSHLPVKKTSSTSPPIHPDHENALP